VNPVAQNKKANVVASKVYNIFNLMMKDSILYRISRMKTFNQIYNNSLQMIDIIFICRILTLILIRCLILKKKAKKENLKSSYKEKLR
jgi:hypothetical protein